MVRILSLLLLCMAVGARPSKAQSLSDVRKQLEEAVGRRPQFSQQKERRIDSLKAQLSDRIPAERQFDLCVAVYREYYTYRFDSAMHYVDRIALLAEQEGRGAWKSLAAI